MRLGARGTPVKVKVLDREVFLCCKECDAKARQDERGTYKRALELKADRDPVDALLEEVAESKGTLEIVYPPVSVLAGLVRIAVGLDRNHGSRVDGVVCHDEGDRLVIEVVPRGDEDIDLELYAAAQRQSLLEEALDCPIEIVAAAEAEPGKASERVPVPQ